MQALEFSTVLNQDLQIEIPEDYRDFLSKRSKLRIIILVEDDELEDISWKSTISEQFLKGYSEEDAIYDNL
jgi:hypothetical protein